jgi:hypothetical protein
MRLTAKITPKLSNVLFVYVNHPQKCYVERIVYDQNGSEEDDSLAQQLDNFEELSTANNDHKWSCPNCGNNFGRSALIHGRPALKLIGGKTRMTKK